MEFEWDPKKSEQNKSKHGVSFSEAIQIWQSPHLQVNLIARSEDGEERGATVGLIGEGVFTAIWTQRDDRIRLISVRRSRNGEKEAFRKKI